MTDPVAPSLNLTPEEKRVFGQLFRQADTEGIGVVTGEVAVKFFEKTRLEPRILGEIWQIADKENRGLLTPAGFGIVLRLIGHYQAGRDPTPGLALEPGPLPKFEGLVGRPISPTVQPPPGPPPSALQPQASGSGPIRVPPLTPEKAGQYAGLFEKSGAQNGVLPGDQAKQIFERAGLPNEVLGRIWNLADTEQRGALHVTEFVIAMHLLASFKSGALRALPNVLPGGLYEAATRRPPSRQTTGVGAVSAIPRQFSGAGPRTSSPLSRSAYGASASAQFPQTTGLGGDWAISPGDKVKFDGIYATLDRTNKGFITGDEAVPFLSESKLPEEALAQIWDLADINSAGHLTRDEFAVAMYLIRQQRGKRDGRDSLPATLPANLVPPSMRNQFRPSSLGTAPAFENSAPSLPKSAAEDLFGLDALSSPTQTSAQVPQSTGGSTSLGGSMSLAGSRQLDTDPFGNGRTQMSSSSAGPSSPQHSTVFKPFAPSSSFGQTLTYNATGGSNSSGPSQPRGLTQQSSAGEDLLGDNDPEISKRLTNETTELANLSNQVGTLSKQMQDVQGQRATTQNELTQANSQKNEFELRLAQLRSLYEQEVKDVKSLEERLAASRNETKKFQTDIAMIEGTYQDLQNQHRQTVTALQADQLENASLKERMRAVNGEISQLKPALEKLRSDARQQKGLVAINKKQLATNEGERDKLKTEADELTKSIEEDTKILAAASRGSSPSQIASPTPSAMSANNPFFRRQGSTSDIPSSPFAPSPVSQQPPDQSFENVFGPSFGAAAAATEQAPPTTFRTESESRSPSNLPASTLPNRVIPTGGSGFPSPSSSSPVTSSRDITQSTEPPPPPQSRQMSSSFLPFPTMRDESLSSSRQVSAPNSRFGEGSNGVDTPTNSVGTVPASSSAAGQTEHVIGTSPGIDRKSTTSPGASDSRDSVPGGFTGDASSQIVDTPTGGSTLSEQAAADPFTANKDLTRSGTAKDDFDSAFAGFGSSAKPQERSNTGSSSTEGSVGAATAGFNKEFPPIAELDHDDESDSASEGGGFEDDFAPASPGHTRSTSKSASTAPQPEPSAVNSMSDILGARPALGLTTSATSVDTNPLSAASGQIPPPAPEKVLPPSDLNRSGVQSLSALHSNLASPKEHMQGSSQSASGQTAFGAPQASSLPVPPAKLPFDDFDNEFDDLEDAKEGDIDDDFANISTQDRSVIDDFNPMFDSIPSSRAVDQSAHGSNGFGGSSVFEVVNESSHQNSQPATTASAVNDSHDWDAIFAGLDGPSPTTATAPPTTAPPTTTAASKATKERPQIGRALTEAGVHDDPILKNLTGMGYARADAVAALEKYDYNLERAANYLANES